MRLMRYFARHYVGAIALTLVALVVLVVAVTLVEKAGVLSRNEHGGMAALGLAYYSAIEYAYQVLPVACLIGVLVAGTQLARRGEVLAVQAAGCGLFQLWTPFAGVVLCVAAMGSACSEFVLPRAVAGHIRLERDETRHMDALNQFYKRRTQWFREGELLLYLPEVDASTAVFSDPIVYRLHDGLIADTIEARSLQHDARGWWLQDAEQHSVSHPEVARSGRLDLALRVKPPDLIDITGNPREMRMGAVSRLIARREHAGLDTTPHRVEMHNRMAYPLTAVGLVMMGLPWAIDPDRRRSLAATLGGGVLLIAAELSLSQVFRLLALAHKLPAVWGAWAAPLVCLLAMPISYALYGRKRRRGSVF